MNVKRQTTMRHCTRFTMFVALLCIIGLAASSAFSHALGNFTINHFVRLQFGDERIAVHYVVDMAEIPALQELQAADAKGNGTPTEAELDAYLKRAADMYVDGLLITVDGVRLPLKATNQHLSLPAGSGGLQTLRLELDYETAPLSFDAQKVQNFRFEDTNQRDRIGWREIVVEPSAAISVFDSTAYSNSVTDELKAYPENLTIAPLNEFAAAFSFTKGEVPANAVAIRPRDTNTSAANSAGTTLNGSDAPANAASQTTTTDKSSEVAFGTSTIDRTRDRLTELISVPTLTPLVALFGLLFAMVLGGLHAMSPGHGKTVVGAYLVGSRGTAKHAAFLGLTVTITHTLGVFALGLITLFASQYILPETLFPVLSFTSGAIVLGIGLSLFVRRLRGTLGGAKHKHGEHEHHDHDHGHEHAHEHDHDHQHMSDPMMPHSHGGGAEHTHMPPGADGEPVTWRSLLALGISGGLLPCPSALVVLLSAISLHRVGYGLLLVMAFSVGLAATLTAVGLAFVYAGRLLKRENGMVNGLTRIMPVLSSFVIACVGALICVESLKQSGVDFNAWLPATNLQTGSVSTFSILVFGLLFGLKHAVEADHLAAVSTIVSERKSILSSSLVGGMWGIGHTISLLVVGIFVIVLRVEIGARLASALEFGVALMLIALGINALRKLISGGTLHLHPHQHFGHAHLHPHQHLELEHPHMHDVTSEIVAADTHHGLRIGARPLLVGIVHGLAGSAALMLLVLSTIKSPLIGMAYIGVFGIGSIGGMMLMSALVGLPIHLTANRCASGTRVLQGLAGAFSLCFGLFMTYEIGYVGGLFR
ncbi:MAG: sulfite exporter TauE/SafE family protein [Pyrinomonadaceae bacterium]